MNVLESSKVVMKAAHKDQMASVATAIICNVTPIKVCKINSGIARRKYRAFRNLDRSLQKSIRYVLRRAGLKLLITRWRRRRVYTPIP